MQTVDSHFLLALHPHHGQPTSGDRPQLPRGLEPLCGSIYLWRWHPYVITRSAHEHEGPCRSFSKIDRRLALCQGFNLRFPGVRLSACKEENLKQARDGVSLAESRRHLPAFLRTLLRSPIHFVFRSSLADARSPAPSRIEAALRNELDGGQQLGTCARHRHVLKAPTVSVSHASCR